MEEQNKIAALEALLFTMGDSVEVGKLAEVIGEDVRTTKKLLAKLQERYEKEDRNNFVKNIILDNVLPGDITLKARELHFNADISRVVFLISIVSYFATDFGRI